MDTPTVPALVAAILASWSVTQLATRDEITARPRRAVRLWLTRRHRRARRAADSGGGLSNLVCTCGYDATRIVGGGEPTRLDAHLALERSRNWWYRLVTCPWCVSFYVAVVIFLTALAWSDGWGWWAVMGPLGARVVAGAGVVHLGPEDDTMDDA